MSYFRMENGGATKEFAFLLCGSDNRYKKGPCHLWHSVGEKGSRLFYVFLHCRWCVELMEEVTNTSWRSNSPCKRSIIRGEKDIRGHLVTQFITSVGASVVG
ncbi:uncharacterized protein LOC134204710 [Armigeres subalbatus]|uniref:uncharacterized protein LOC134204710 n=1 Tax=Armigeres subalbatus TaxID=124917 RepID=UPI002ED3B327